MADIHTPDNPPANHLGALVRVRRRELGLTQAELAARIEKSPSYISALESGSVAPSLTTLPLKLAQFVSGFLVNSPPETAPNSSISIPAGWDYNDAYTVIVSKAAYCPVTRTQ